MQRLCHLATATSLALLFTACSFDPSGSAAYGPSFPDQPSGPTIDEPPPSISGAMPNTRDAIGGPAAETGAATPSPGTPPASAPIAPGVIDLYASADAYVSEETPSAGEGTAEEMAVGVQPARRIAYLKFDLASVPGGATVTEATLRLCVDQQGQGAASTEHDLVRLIGSWDEQTISWATQPDAAVEPTVAITIAATSGCAELDVTHDLKLWVEGGFKAHGWRIVSPDGAANERSYCTREHGEQGMRPRLHLSYSTP